jgi:hypothetical protein
LAQQHGKHGRRDGEAQNGKNIHGRFSQPEDGLDGVKKAGYLLHHHKQHHHETGKRRHGGLLLAPGANEHLIEHGDDNADSGYPEYKIYIHQYFPSFMLFFPGFR